MIHLLSNEGPWKTEKKWFLRKSFAFHEGEIFELYVLNLKLFLQNQKLSQTKQRFVLGLVKLDIIFLIYELAPKIQDIKFSDRIFQ